MGLRAIPSHLCMAEAVPFGQRYNYHTRHPIDAVLDPEYFVSLRHQLRVGDEIRVCRVVGDRVRHIFDLIVVELPPKSIELHMPGRLIEIPSAGPVAQTSAREPDERYIHGDGRVSWNLGKQMFEVKVDGKIVAEVRDKAEAWRIAQGEVPLPDQEPEAA